MTEQFYTRSEAAKLLRISERSLGYLTTNGRITSIRVGRRRLYPADALLNYGSTAVRGREYR